MTSFTRYAIFFAPRQGSALARFGASWLGWDPDAGERVAHPTPPGMPVPVAELTAAPRKYGFHGTLKPPFRLAEGHDPQQLRNAAAALAAELPRIAGPPLALRRLGRFVALMPSGPFPGLDGLAAACVTELDAFRAPASEAELARRRAAGLTPAQKANLAKWGYPYAFDEFRFHLTLTGALEAQEATPVIEELASLTAPFCQDPFTISEICLFGESESGRFRLLERLPLAR